MDWKNKFKPENKTKRFYDSATGKGVIIACQKCKEPFWNVVVDTKTGEATKQSFRADWQYDDVWTDLNPHDMKPCPKCGTKDWMMAIKAGDKLFPKPYILGGL